MDTESQQGSGDFREPQQRYEMAVHSFPEGVWILREGQENRDFFVILDGSVRITKDDKVVRVLGEEDVFGLESILLRMPSPFGAKAVSNCRISAYGIEAIDYFLSENSRMTQSLLKSLLRQLVWTSKNMVDQNEPFSAEDAEVRFFSDGEVILEQGMRSKEFYRLVSSQQGLIVSRGGVEVNRITQPGEFFGEMAGLLSAPRHASVTSSGDSVVEVFSADKLDLIINDYPALATRLIQTLASRLARTSMALSNLHHGEASKD